MQLDHQVSNNPLTVDSQKKGRFMVFSMIVFFLVPILVVILMVKFDWKPETGNSLGQLVKPARLIVTPAELKTSDNQLVTSDFWKDKWSLVYVADHCEEACESKLHDMRQIHVSLYKDMARAQRVLITSQMNVAKYKIMYPELLVINQTDAARDNLSEQFNMPNEAATKTDRLYLVDALGHIMMSYPSAAKPANIRKDIAQLLRYSWAG